MITLSTEQKEVVEHEGSCSVFGAPGVGKTTVLIERVAKLLNDGVQPEEIHVVAFTYYSWKILAESLRKRLGDVATRLNIGSFRVFAQQQMEKDDGKELIYSTDKQARRYLRQAMREVEFKGTAVEAEHIIRNFKSLARKPEESARHYDLLCAYKRFCEMDRYDVLRKHIIGIRQGEYHHAPLKYVFVDNFQDVARIQYLWLAEHVKVGTIASVFGDDDLCAFKRDGSLGAQAFIDFKDMMNLKEFSLSNSHRLSVKLGVSSQAIVRNLKNRLSKNVSYNKDKDLPVFFESSASADEELMVLAQQIKAVPPQKRIGVITRTDEDALRVQKVFEKQGIEHSSFAHKIWEIPGAIMVLDLLCLLLNQASDICLKNVLIGYGLNQKLIGVLFKEGLHALDWLPSGAKLPKEVQLPPGAVSDYTTVQRQLLGYFALLQKKVASPQDIFKAASYDMIENMNEEDRLNAIVAVDTLINLKGPLKEVLPQIREGKEPDITDRIIVGPVRDMRNLEFDHVFMPLATKEKYPYSGYQILGVDEPHDKRLFYMAVTRASEALHFSWNGYKSPFVSTIEKEFS